MIIGFYTVMPGQRALILPLAFVVSLIAGLALEWFAVKLVPRLWTRGS